MGYFKKHYYSIVNNLYTRTYACISSSLYFYNKSIDLAEIYLYIFIKINKLFEYYYQHYCCIIAKYLLRKSTLHVR